MCMMFGASGSGNEITESICRGAAGLLRFSVRILRNAPIGCFSPPIGIAAAPKRVFLVPNNTRRPHGCNCPIGAPTPILWISEVVLKQYVPIFVKHIIGKVNRSGGTGWDPRTGTVIKCLLDLYSLSRSDDVVGNSTFELSDSATIRG